MKNLLRVYRTALRYWGFGLAGLVTMCVFAVFSGVSIMMVIPLFDYVFIPDKVVKYDDFSSFSLAFENALQAASGQIDSFWGVWRDETLTTVMDYLGDVLYHTDSFLLLQIIAGVTVGLFFFKNLFFYLHRVMFINLQGKIVRDMRDMMFTSFLRQTVAFFGRNRVGDSLVRMVNDVEIVSNSLLMSLFNTLREVVMVFVYAYIALRLNSELFLYSVIVLPVFSILISYLGRKIKKYSKRVQSQFSHMFSAVEEIMNNMKIVKAFAREDREFQRVHKVNSRYFKYWRKVRLYDVLNVPLSEFTSSVTGVIVLLIGGQMVLDPAGAFSFGDFLAFLFAVFSMLHPLKVIGKAYTSVRKGLVSLDRIGWVLDLEPEIVEKPDAKAVAGFEREIGLSHVGFSYDGKTPVLGDVSLHIHKGERVALVGASGSGKTTLVNLIARLYDVTKGSIAIDGVDVRDLKIPDLRSLFGIVTQESILFADTVEGNIRYGTRKTVSDDAVRQAARIAYADEYIERMERQYDTPLQSRGSNLSGGQRQRLCIARAIVGDPPILIFDEATSALDTESEQKVQKAIDQATKNRTVIVIAHRLSTILSSDKIVVMDAGAIVGMGKHDELLESCPRYKTLYDMQFGLATDKEKSEAE